MTWKKLLSPKLHFTAGCLLILIGIGLFSLYASHAPLTAYAGSDYYPPASFNGMPIATVCPTNASVDDTVPLSEWIATVPNGSTIEFPAGNCYEIEGSVVIANRQNLTLNGNATFSLGASADMPTTVTSFNGAEFEAETDGSGVSPPTGYGLPDKFNLWPRDRSQFIVYDSSGITFENMWVHGSANVNVNGEGLSDKPSGSSCTTEVLNPPDNCSYEGQYGIVFRGSGGTVTNDKITDTNSDLVGVTADDPSNDTDPTPASYVNITGNYLYGSDRDGPSIYDGNHVTVNNNYVGNTAPYAVIFDTEPVATRWQNDYISFTNNTIGLHDNTWVSGAGASAVNNNIVVENNVVLTNKGTDSSGMAFGQGLSTNPSLSTITNPAIRQNLTIENNSGGSSSPNTERGSITVSGFNNVVISGNSMNVDTKSVAGSAFALNIVTNTTISNNDIIQSGSNPFTLFNIVDNKSSLVAANNTFCNNKVNGVIADGSCSNPTTPHQTTPTPSTGQSGSQATSGNTKNSPGGTSGHIQSTGAPTPSSSAASTKSESSAQQEQAEQSSVPIPLIHTRVSREYVAASAYSFIMMGSLGISFAVIHRKLFWI